MKVPLPEKQYSESGKGIFIEQEITAAIRYIML